MNKAGITIKIDALGRILIPKEYRNEYRLDGEVELVTTSEGLLIRNPEYEIKEKKST